METKVCSKCFEVKALSEFRKDNTKKDGLRPDCKKCVKDYEFFRRKDNPLMMKEKLKIFYQKNPEKRKEYRKNYKKRKHQQRKERRISDPIFNLTNRMRCRIYKYLKIMNISKKNKTFDIVGCTPESLKKYLENQFTEGMSWDLFGEHIHIDHIIPLSSAKTEKELYELCHYTNLQPLWAIENIRKSNQIIK
jgi:hypothetical protein